VEIAGQPAMTRRKVDDGGVPADGGILLSSGYTSTNAVSPDGSLRLRAVLPRSGTTPISASASDRKRSVIPDLVDPVTAGDEFLQHPHNLLSRLREESPAWSAGARRWFAWRVRANLALICAPGGRKTPAGADTKDGERKAATRRRASVSPRRWRAARNCAESWAPNRSASVSRSNWPRPCTTISSNGLRCAGSSTVATWMPYSR
jgi:hypothetical protein